MNIIINKYYAVAIISFALTVGLIFGSTLQMQSDIEQIKTIMTNSAYSESHLLSTDGINVYYITPYVFNLSSLNISNKRR